MTKEEIARDLYGYYRSCTRQMFDTECFEGLEKWEKEYLLICADYIKDQKNKPQTTQK